jgi:leucine efflux protein
VAALLAAYPAVFTAVQVAGAAYLAWIGLRLLLARGDGSASPIHIEPRHYARQAFFVTLLNPKAIVFYMAFFPLFIDPATHRGLPTFGAMALTIAAITAAYCLALCAFAQAVAEKVKAHRSVTRWLERAAGVFLIGFGIRLVKD